MVSSVFVAAPDDMVFPLPANLPAPRGYSRVLTVVGSQPVAIECSFMAPSSDGGATLVSGLKETGVDTLKMVCELIVDQQELLSAVLGQQAEFGVLGPGYWITRGVPHVAGGGLPRQPGHRYHPIGPRHLARRGGNALGLSGAAA